MIAPGERNSITDVAGLRVGNAHDSKLRSGVTVLLCDSPAVAAVHAAGGAPGTRETDLLAPENAVEQVNAVVLSGGSAFGLDAAGGVQSHLREQGKGYRIAGRVVPIVPAAILFDLLNGGDKDWGFHSPYRDLGAQAAQAAQAEGFEFDVGTAGAGYGALTASLKGGLGSASSVLPNGITLGALAAVNALGDAVIGETESFWAAAFEEGNEFGGKGYPFPFPGNAREIRVKARGWQSAGMNTTIAAIATDAILSKPQAKRLAIAAHDGIARAIWPAHTPLDGDLIFSLATGSSGVVPALDDWIDLGAIAASTLARAIARAVYAAAPKPRDVLPAYEARAASGKP